jgi:hypothetical protein
LKHQIALRLHITEYQCRRTLDIGDICFESHGANKLVGWLIKHHITARRNKGRLATDIQRGRSHLNNAGRTGSAEVICSGDLAERQQARALH